MNRARDWGVATFKALGFENVHVENFTTKVWSRGAESAEVVAPYPQKLRVLAIGGSASTPAGGLTAPIVVFHTYQDMLAQPEGSLKGKIAVVTQAMVRTQGDDGYDFGNQQRRGAGEAAKRGAAGYLIRSISTASDREPHTGGGGYGGIPAGALSPVDAEQLDRLAARGTPVTVKLVLESRVNEAAEAYNVVGEIKGSSTADQVIVVGGHLNSWDPGTGAIDDGAGVAITTAAAKIAASLGHPKRTIRVVMWGSEEQGGSSGAYAKAHESEIAKIVVVGESDDGADSIWSALLPKGSADHPAMAMFRNTIVPLKVIGSKDPAEFGGADVTGMVRAGAPVVEFRQDMNRYFDVHHSANDTLAMVDPKQLAQNVAVWASFLYTVANSDIDFHALAAKAK